MNKYLKMAMDGIENNLIGVAIVVICMIGLGIWMFSRREGLTVKESVTTKKKEDDDDDDDGEDDDDDDDDDGKDDDDDEEGK